MSAHKATTLLTLFAVLGVASAAMTAAAATPAFAEVPSWIKTNAGWWADGTISDSEFLAGISYLISIGTITIPPADDSDAGVADNTAQQEDFVPPWIKTNAGWWADGMISDDDFLNGIQYLIRVGLITVSPAATPEDGSDPGTPVTEQAGTQDDPVMADLQRQLEECAKITKAYQRIDCEKPVKQAITLHDYKTNADAFPVGPVTYYWFGMGSEGNSFEISQSGQALLSIRMLAENTSDEVQSLNCTSPSLCSYDAWDGSTAFRYAGTDFTSGQIVLNPGDAREFNMLFGPNVGYGGSQFLYDESKTYHFRINESFGSKMVPLNLN